MSYDVGKSSANVSDKVLGRRWSSSRATPRQKTRGVVLVLVLVFLLLTGFATSTALNTATLELRMARNTQFRVQAQQYAQAILDAIVTNPENFPLDSDVGQRWCSSVDDAPECDSSVFLQLPAALKDVLPGVTSSYQVRRREPVEMQYKPRQEAGDEEAYPVAVFESWVVVDGSKRSLARAELVQGLIIKLPGELNTGFAQQLGVGADAGECDKGQCTFSPGELKQIYWRDPGIDRD
jgi:hypothetical protein